MGKLEPLELVACLGRLKSKANAVLFVTASLVCVSFNLQLFD